MQSHSASVLSIKLVYMIRQQIGSRNQAKSTDRTWRQIGERNRGSAAFVSI